MHHNQPITELTAFFNELAGRWDAMMSPDRDVLLAGLLAPHAALFSGVHAILDIGTGTGAFLPHLARLAPGAHVVAVDLSPEMLRRARSSGRTDALLCRLLRADAERLPLAAESFDLITCHDSFAHLEDRAGALRGFARVLRLGGKLLILHDIPRAKLNTIHGSATHKRIRTHTLPPIKAITPLVETAGLRVLAAEDTDTHILITAKRL